MSQILSKKIENLATNSAEKLETESRVSRTKFPKLLLAQQEIVLVQFVVNKEILTWLSKNFVFSENF